MGRSFWARTSLFVVVGLLVAALLGGTALAATKLTWWTAASTDKLQEGVYHDLAQAFQALHPDIEVEVVGVSGIADKLLLAVSTGTAPDLFTHYFSADIARHGWIEELTKYFERDGIVPERTWFPAAVERIKYQGGYYAVPRDISPAAVGYNKSILARRGVAEPGPGYDLDQFLADLTRVNDPDNGLYALDYEYRGVGALEWTSLAANLNVQLVSADGRTVVGYLDSEDTLNAFDWWADVHVRGLTQPSAVKAGLGSGQVAFGTISLWEIGLLEDPNIGVFGGPVRQGSEPVVWADSYPTYMWSGSPNKEAAWEFMKWLSTSVEAARIVARHRAWASPSGWVWLELGLDADPVYGRFWELAQRPAEIPNYLRTEYQWNIVQPAIENAWDQAVNKASGSLRSLLREAAVTIQAQLDEAYR